MSEEITEELREYVSECSVGSAASDSNCYLLEVNDIYADHTFCESATLKAIIDRIDEAHKKAVRKAALGGSSVVLATATDKDLAEHGLCRLPVDAGGVIVKPGDVLVDERGDYRKVTSVQYYEDSKYLVFAMESGSKHRSSNINLSKCHHNSTPSERIREIADSARDTGTHSVSIAKSDLARLRAIADELEGEDE